MNCPTSKCGIPDTRTSSWIVGKSVVAGRNVSGSSLELYPVLCLSFTVVVGSLLCPLALRKDRCPTETGKISNKR